MAPRPWGPTPAEARSSPPPPPTGRAGPVAAGKGGKPRAAVLADPGRNLHEGSRSIDAEEPGRRLPQHDGSQRPEPLPALHGGVDVGLHARMTGVREDAPVAEGPGPRLAAALVQAHDPAAVEEVHHRLDEVLR